MGIGVSIFFLAVGAILTFAVEVEAEGFNINTIGVILMVVGALGILLSLAFWNSWGGWGRRDVVADGAPRRRTTVVED